MSRTFFHRSASALLALVLALIAVIPAAAAPPSNDNFADAHIIASLPFSDTVDMTEAGVEPGEPASCSSADRTVWYAFTPSDTILVRITRQGTANFSNLTVFHATGPDISDLEFLWCPLYSAEPLTLEAGETYYIQAGAFPCEVGTIEINMEQVLPPVNDNFAGATTIASLPYNTSVEIGDAWTEPGEIGFCSPAYKTVWYSFTPAESMMLSLDLQGSSIFGTAATYVATGPSISDLNFLGCNSLGSFSFLAEPGQTYYFQLGALYDAFGSIDFHLRQIFPPPNDNFENAQPIESLPFSDTINQISEATTEPNEQQWCALMERTVWYSFTPAETMLVQADTEGSSVASQMTIYRAFGPGIGGLSVIACPGTFNPVTLILEAGQTYYFQVGATDGQTGDIQIHLEPVPPPANDDFSAAAPITSVPSTTDFDTNASTFEGSEPVPTCVSPSPSPGTVWFAFTAPQTQTLSMSVINNNFSAFLAVYSGSTLGNLTEIGCRSFDRLSFGAVAGQTYYIQVGGSFGGYGTGALLVEPAPPPQSNFYYYPNDPNRFDAILFQDISGDPANIGIQTIAWNFGDGTSASGNWATHQYAADGNYQVTQTVTTIDGRTGSSTQTVQIRTHDVAITRVTAPNSASAGQTRSVTVNLRNTAYPEIVQVDLYRSVPGGYQWVATLTRSVPALSGNRTTSVAFNYTFTSDDARNGKVTFKVIATIVGARDALPVDNEAVSSPPTKVTR